MKLYRQSGTYYEKQADVPKGKFETVEFPFAASPKADFVAWLNAQAFESQLRQDDASPYVGQAERIAEEMFPAAKPVGPCASTAPSPAKDDLAFRREVSEWWDSLPLTYRLDLGMLAFEDARNVVRG